VKKGGGKRGEEPMKKDRMVWPFHDAMLGEGDERKGVRGKKATLWAGGKEEKKKKMRSGGQ